MLDYKVSLSYKAIGIWSMFCKNEGISTILTNLQPMRKGEQVDFKLNFCLGFHFYGMT